MAKQKKKLTQQEIRRILILSAILLVVSLTLYNIVRIKELKQEAVTKELTTEKSYGEADIGGDFTMTNQDGKQMKFSDTNGKLRLVFFGFTNCPDVCPTTLLTITNTMNKLGAQADKVQPVFITVDPDRDSPQVMKQYLGNFYPGIIGLTGTKAELEKATQAYKAYYSAQAPAAHEHGANAHEEHADHGAGSYNVDHSGFIYIMDKDGKYLAHKEYTVSDEELAKTITSYLK